MSINGPGGLSRLPSNRFQGLEVEDGDFDKKSDSSSESLRKALEKIDEMDLSPNLESGSFDFGDLDHLDLFAPQTDSSRISLSPDRDEFLGLGEGNFSFFETLVERRRAGEGRLSKERDPDFGSRAVVTEYKSRNQVMADSAVATRIARLQSEHNVRCFFGVDATQIDRTFAGRTFRRIQWNCPDLREPFYSYDSELPETIQDFAMSAAKLQNIGDHLHISLIAPPGKKGEILQGIHYGITGVEDFEDEEGAGYLLKAIRPSGANRYTYVNPEGTKFSWEHEMSSSFGSLDLAREGIEEYVFEKVADVQERTQNYVIESIRGFKRAFSPNGRSYDRISFRGSCYRGTRKRAHSDDF